MIKLIALDLDDTLLCKNKEISIENQKAIAFAKSQGINIVIASGRPFFRITPILQRLHLMEDKNYIIALNGGLIVTSQEEVLYQKVLSHQDIWCIADVLVHQQLSFLVYQNNQIYAYQLDNDIKQLPIFQDVELKDISRTQLKEMDCASKMIVVATKEQIDCYQPQLMTLLSNYTVVRTTPYFLEILPKNVDKGSALCFLATHLGISLQEMMAIGDAENDISMLKQVGVGVAMGNATKEVIQVAHFVTLSCEEDGVAYAIYQIIQSMYQEKNS